MVSTSNKKPWASFGIAKKPDSCGLCAFSQVGHGFTGDFVPLGAKMIFLFGSPLKGDVQMQKPGSSGFGSFIRKQLIEDFGHKSHEVALCNVMRCMPPFVKGEPAYPTGYLKEQAESNCRQYDKQRGHEGKLISGGLTSLKPDACLVTFDMYRVLTVNAFKELIIQDVKKAWKLVDTGYTPVVLFGAVPMELVAKHLHGGGVKAWRSHWWQIQDWPY